MGKVPALPESNTIALQAQDLVKTFRLSRAERRVVWAVNHVSLDVHQSEVLGVVGESGSGKTTLALIFLGLCRPDSGVARIGTGSGHLVGWDEVAPRDRKRLRCQVQPVFQDPYSSLNPRLRVRAAIEEPLRIQNIGDATERRARVKAALESVGLPEVCSMRYPRELSGGERQRVALARALVLEPAVLIADEPIAGLDVSLQAQIAQLLRGLQAERRFTCLFVSHNLEITAFLSHRIAVMYAGTIVEIGATRDVLERPSHPYTQLLLAARPRMASKVATRSNKAEPHTPVSSIPDQGCPFEPRCSQAQPLCRQERPRLIPICMSSHWVACHGHNLPAER